MTSIIVNQNYGHNLIKYFKYVKQKTKARGMITRAAYIWCRGTESNCRHGDFQTKFLKFRKCCDYNQLILFRFFRLFLVSFGIVWKYLTLTGTIWAQFCFINFVSLSTRPRPPRFGFGHSRQSGCLRTVRTARSRYSPSRAFQLPPFLQDFR